MKPIIIIAFIISTSSIFSQEIVSDSVIGNESKFYLTVGQKLPKTCFFKDTNFDSLSLHTDTLILLKQMQNEKSARLKLLNESEFQIVYDLRYDTIQSDDTTAGYYSENIVLNSKKIEGEYCVMCLQSSTNGVDSEVIEMSLELSLKSKELFIYERTISLRK
ncbi:hypothetical protein [Saccharicrinis aurantiacus]|uniref:hypothetical protein n=1 Tax=Saccharicrinis aurantiacus TaxID=1849719 RepID=UPI0024925D8C|nr:hypothetical protein [Saccharicrinis aurantiacus]